MITTTQPALVKKIYDTLGRGSVILHQPTETNMIGQSGLHTFITDILDIVDVSLTPHEQVKNLYKYLKEGAL